jgi:tRNA threonylcarbamoyladenosine biosynthesis protein TsaE
MSLNWHATEKSADNPPKPKAKALWRRRMHIGTTGMPVRLFSMKKITFYSYSAKDTIRLAKKIARFLNEGDTLGLFGDLGAGKTTFVKGLALGLGIKSKINSPSFVILKVYPRLYHFDLYRLKSLKGLQDIGFEDFINSNGICVIEWADKARGLLPGNYLKINIKIKNQNSRIIEIVPYGERYRSLLSRLK